MSFNELSQVLGNWGEFIGSIAILITLIYLAVQVRQARRSAMFASVQANRAERMAWFQSNRDSPFMPHIFAKAEAGQPLTSEEAFRLRSHNSALWGSIYSQWLQQEMGLWGKFATKDDAMLQMAVKTPGAMEWWQGAGDRVYPDEFRAYVEARLLELGRVNKTDGPLY